MLRISRERFFLLFNIAARPESDSTGLDPESDGNNSSEDEDDVISEMVVVKVAVDQPPDESSSDDDLIPELQASPRVPADDSV